MLLNAPLPALPLSYLFLVVVVPVLFILHKRFTRRPTAFDQLAWAGIPAGFLGRLRVKYATASRERALLDAYDKYASKEQAFIWQPLAAPAMVIVPESQLRFVIDQPLAVANSHEYFDDMYALETSLRDPMIHENPIQNRVVANELTRSLAWAPGPVGDELARCFDDYWGRDPEWKEIQLLPTLVKLVARTINRMFVGEELCRNDEYIGYVAEWTIVFFKTGVKLRPFPQWARKIIAAYFAKEANAISDGVFRLLGPIVERRKAEHERKLADPDYKYEKREDLLQWIIENAYSLPDLTERSTERIVKRVLSVNLAAVHTTATNSCRLIFNLAGTDPKQNVISRIRDQIIETQREHKGEWNKSSLAKLTLLDSALRETLRLDGGVFAPSRKVVAKEGLTLPDGLYIPHGSHLASLMYGIHRKDGSLFEFDAFRFVPSSERKTEGGGQRALQATATGNDFLPFGHGRDSCPGRFFAVQEIKLMMVHLLMNYELEHQERPPEMWIADMQLAPPVATIKMRKVAPPAMDAKGSS